MMKIEDVQLVLLDIQGKLAQIVHDSEAVLRNTSILVQGCKALEVPIVWVEQMPDKLGATHPEVAAVLEWHLPVKKSCFSACGAPAFVEQLAQNKRKQVLLLGIETHICVYQTAVDLLARDYDVYVIADAVSSRTESNRRIGLQMLREVGAKTFSTEAVLFNLLGTAQHPKFKEIAKLVR